LSGDTLPEAPADLRYGAVKLYMESIGPGDPALGYVPYYHFDILSLEGCRLGHINFRVGDTPHILRAAGHIGYAVTANHRGHGYAYQACRAIAPFVFSLYDSVIITCDPGNAPSIKTIEKLGAEFLGEAKVPPEDPMYAKGVRIKLRYRWSKDSIGED
jgi:predicted acetyltransferase